AAAGGAPPPPPVPSALPPPGWGLGRGGGGGARGGGPPPPPPASDRMGLGLRRHRRRLAGRHVHLVGDRAGAGASLGEHSGRLAPTAGVVSRSALALARRLRGAAAQSRPGADRKSTRLNSSH